MQKLWLFLAVPLCVLGLANAQKPISKPVTVKKEISVESVQFAVFERDLTEPKEYTKVKQNEKLPGQVQVDSHKKMQLRFTVKEKKAQSAITVHQAFIAMVHVQTQRELIYVAEPDKTSKAYSFDLDLKTHHKDFAGVSGKYTLRLILGDAAVSNPVDWTIAELTVNAPTMDPTPVPKSKQISYDSLPEIKHLFRKNEQQPPVPVSHFFAVLCAVPFLILIVSWLRIGINIGNVKISLWALGFHVGLAGVFGLYFLYWQRLNMFETLQYLTLVGAATFVCGNRLLHSFNSEQKEKSE